MLSIKQNLTPPLICGCCPFGQSKSVFCDQKFNFPFYQGLNQSKMVIQLKRSTFGHALFRLVAQPGLIWPFFPF